MLVGDAAATAARREFEAFVSRAALNKVVLRPISHDDVDESGLAIESEYRSLKVILNVRAGLVDVQPLKAAIQPGQYKRSC